MENQIINPIEDFMKDFVNEDLRSFKTSNGREFSYKPTTGGDELLWIDEYLSADGKTDRGKLNRCKMLNIKKIPYPKELIKQIIGIDKEWDKLSQNERWTFLNKLSPEMVGEIITEINKIDNGDNEVKKK